VLRLSNRRYSENKRKRTLACAQAVWRASHHSAPLREPGDGPFQHSTTIRCLSGTAQQRPVPLSTTLSHDIGYVGA
jgi:hypothetical protein